MQSTRSLTLADAVFPRVHGDNFGVVLVRDVGLMVVFAAFVAFTLFPVLKDSDPEMRKLGAEALGSIENVNSVDELMPLVRLYEVERVSVYAAVRLALLCQLVIAPLAIYWLRQVVAVADRSTQERERLERTQVDLAPGGGTQLGGRVHQTEH
jgi:hypothetical protein